jgi:hypothetical protein
MRAVAVQPAQKLSRATPLRTRPDSSFHPVHSPLIAPLRFLIVFLFLAGLLLSLSLLFVPGYHLFSRVEKTKKKRNKSQTTTINTTQASRLLQRLGGAAGAT